MVGQLSHVVIDSLLRYYFYLVFEFNCPKHMVYLNMTVYFQNQGIVNLRLYLSLSFSKY